MEQSHVHAIFVMPQLYGRCTGQPHASAANESCTDQLAVCYRDG